jgi:DNA-directed RNA polymerases I, II, and III subunit RPABC1
MYYIIIITMSLLDKIYKSRKTVIELMEDRGVNMDKFKEYTINEVELMVSNMPKANKDISPVDITLDKGIIKYILTPKIRVTNLMSLTNQILEDYSEGDTIIFIIRDKITSEDSIDEFFRNIYIKEKIFVQFFHLDTLTFNVTNHSLVPRHEILSKEETNELIKSLYITDIKKLPKINASDPISKYYGIKRGEVFRITRPSETSGISYYYRVAT